MATLNVSCDAEPTNNYPDPNSDQTHDKQARIGDTRGNKGFDADTSEPVWAYQTEECAAASTNGDGESNGFILKVLWRPVNRNSGLAKRKKGRSIGASRRPRSLKMTAGAA